MAESWELIEITRLGDPGQTYLVYAAGKLRLLARDVTAKGTLEVWGDWEWRD